jgi:hypothetical protein
MSPYVHQNDLETDQAAREQARPRRWPILVKLFFVGLLVFSYYHIARDISTEVFKANYAIVNVAHRPHDWCKPACGYVVCPLRRSISPPFRLFSDEIGWVYSAY